MTTSNGWRAQLTPGASEVPPLELDQKNTALLIVDMQNYGANPHSDRGRLMTKKSPDSAESYFTHLRDTVIPNQRLLLDCWHRLGQRVIYLTAGALLPDGTDMSLRRQRRDEERLADLGVTDHMHPGTNDYQILDELEPQPGELVIPKNSIGAFNSSPIDQILRNMGITGLVIVGVITEGCVETTARDAADRGYDCILVEDGCASSLNLAAHEASLLSFARMFGEVWSTREVLEWIEGKVPATAMLETSRAS